MRRAEGNVKASPSNLHHGTHHLPTNRHRIECARVRDPRYTRAQWPETPTDPSHSTSKGHKNSEGKITGNNRHLESHLPGLTDTRISFDASYNRFLFFFLNKTDIAKTSPIPFSPQAMVPLTTVQFPYISHLLLQFSLLLGIYPSINSTSKSHLVCFLNLQTLLQLGFSTQQNVWRFTEGLGKSNSIFFSYNGTGHYS